MSTATNWSLWEDRFREFLSHAAPGDAAHDLAHITRVVTTAKRLAEIEQAVLEVVIPAAWLHDCMIVPKDSPVRSQASMLAAQTAGRFLRECAYPGAYIAEIEHAIESHSFSAKIQPRTIEAKVVQDADRLDALGAIGIARCFGVGGALGRPLYDPAEPFPTTRPPDDRANSVDHFFVKLLTLEATMHTDAGKAEARRRTEFMRAFLAQLGREIGVAELDAPQPAI